METLQIRAAARLIRTLLLAGVAAALAGGTALPARAHDDEWRGRHEWRDHAWRQHEWREREWREHEWRERHWHRGYAVPGYSPYGYPPPVIYAPPPSYFDGPPPAAGFNFVFPLR